MRPNNRPQSSTDVCLTRRTPVSRHQSLVAWQRARMGATSPRPPPRGEVAPIWTPCAGHTTRSRPESPPTFWFTQPRPTPRCSDVARVARWRMRRWARLPTVSRFIVVIVGEVVGWWTKTYLLQLKRGGEWGWAIKSCARVVCQPSSSIDHDIMHVICPMPVILSHCPGPFAYGYPGIFWMRNAAPPQANCESCPADR